jgi:hypothetical protein
MRSRRFFAARRVSAGIGRAARQAMIAMTISNPIRVNAPLGLFVSRAACPLL